MLNDIIIQKALFKYPVHAVQDTEVTQVHPALNKIRYTIGKDPDAMLLSSSPLTGHAVFNDLAFIPAMKQVQFTIAPRGLTLATRLCDTICFTVKNPDGVLVRDVMNQLAIEGRRPRDVLALTSCGALYQRYLGGMKPALFPTSKPRNTITLAARRSSSSLRGPKPLAAVPIDANEPQHQVTMLGHHSLAHELAVALMPEPSAGSKLLAEEFGIEYDDGAEGIDDVPSSARHPDDPHSTLGSSIADSDMPSFADELGASASDASFYETSEPDDHFPQEEFDPVFSAPPTATTPSRKQLVPETKVPEQDAMEILAQDLESTDKFLNHLRGVDAEHATKLSSHHPTKLERLASDVIRKMNESVREREGQVRDLLECEREFRKISGEVGGNEVLGQVDELPNIDDLSDKPLSLNRQDSTSSHQLRHLDAVVEEEQPRSPIHPTHRHTQQHHLSVTDWETDPDRPHLGDEDYLSEEPIASPIKDSFAPPPPIAGPITPASAIPQLSHLRSFTTSLVSSLTTISEQAQVNGAATSEAGRKIRALKNKLGSWRTDWDSAERSRLKIERWEAGIVDSDGTGTPDSATVSPLSSSQRVSKRVDGRQIVAEHLKAFEKALEEASQKTRAIMLR